MAAYLQPFRKTKLFNLHMQYVHSYVAILPIVNGKREKRYFTKRSINVGSILRVIMTLIFLSGPLHA